MSIRQPLLIPIFHEGRECYQLVEPWTSQAVGVTITVPEGFVCDGASIPRLLWNIKPPDGIHRASAVFHDWLYGNKGEFSFGSITRKECDQVFRDLLVKAGVSKFQAWLMYRGVRLGGWVTWSKPKHVVIIPVSNISTLLTIPSHADEWEGHILAP